jgi:hypothetical protein
VSTHHDAVDLAFAEETKDAVRRPPGPDHNLAVDTNVPGPLCERLQAQLGGADSGEFVIAEKRRPGCGRGKAVEHMKDDQFRTKLGGQGQREREGFLI